MNLSIDQLILYLTLRPYSEFHEARSTFSNSCNLSVLRYIPNMSRLEHFDGKMFSVVVPCEQGIDQKFEKTNFLHPFSVNVTTDGSSHYKGQVRARQCLVGMTCLYSCEDPQVLVFRNLACFVSIRNMGKLANRLNMEIHGGIGIGCPKKCSAVP